MSDIFYFTVIQLIESPLPYLKVSLDQSISIPKGGKRISDVCICIFNFAVLCQVSNCNFAKLGKNWRVI